MKAIRLAVLTFAIWSGGVPFVLIYLGWAWFQ